MTGAAPSTAFYSDHAGSHISYVSRFSVIRNILASILIAQINNTVLPQTGNCT